MKGGGRLLTAVGLLVVIGLGAAFWFANRGPGEPPDVSGVTLNLVLDPSQVKTFVKEHDGDGSSVVSAAPADSQVVAGAITFPAGTPLSDQDYYSLFVIDKANNDVALDVWGLPSERQDLTRGWDGRYSELVDEYPWLSPVAPVDTESGWTDPGTTLAFGADTLDRGLNFAAWLQPTGLVLENSDQLTIALAAWDDDGDLAWAVPLGQPASTS